MPEYEFTLTFNLPDAQSNPEDYLESLATVGCDDALIGIGKRGKIALDFIRESSSAKEAVYSARVSASNLVSNVTDTKNRVQYYNGPV
ncbi:hypothetical protein, partial [Laspinema olomoucense]|uniref:hypothetical protein n=1 Tax=Laspinema olomoucense TaxID=3231600 RepID=UPI0021BA59EE